MSRIPGASVMLDGRDCRRFLRATRISAVPSVPTMMRHRPPGSLPLRARLLSLRFSHAVAGDGGGVSAAAGAVVAPDQRDGSGLSLDRADPGAGGAAAGSDALAGFAALGVRQATLRLVMGAFAESHGIAPGHAEETLGPRDRMHCD